MSSDFQPFQPRSEFVRTETAPQTYALVALNGADTLRCHNISPAALSALREVFGQEMRLYGENAENQVAEFVFRSSPWSAKTARSETLITNIFTVLLIHQYTFLTTIDYGRQYLDKLSLTFTRPSSLTTPAPATESIFALSFTAPTILRVLNAPLHATPAILQSVRGTWPRGVKGERKLGGGSWEFRLKGFGYFSTEKSDESILPHVFTLLRALDAHAFRLVAAIPIGGRSRSKDLWIFTAPGVSSTGSGSVLGNGSVGVGSSKPTSPYQPTIDSEWTYTSGPETASPIVGHGRFATDEPSPVGFGAGMAGVGVGGSKGHRRSSSAPVAVGGSKGRKPVPALTPPRGSPSQSPGLKGTTPPSVKGSPLAGTSSMPSPSPMVMPVPMIPPPLSPVSQSSFTPTPTQSPAHSSTPLGSFPAMVPVPIPQQKRNSSLLRKFRAGGTGRTGSGRFNHPPPPTARQGNGSPPNVPNGNGSSAEGNGNGVGMPERKRTIVSGEVIYETPAPPSSGSPTPNAGVSPAPPITTPTPATGPAMAMPSPTGFVPPPPPPPIPTSPTGVDPRAPGMPIPIVPPAPTSASEEGQLAPPDRPGMLTPANRTTEELLLPRGAFRDSAFSASTDQSHDVAVAWTGPGSLGGLGGIVTGGLGGVKEGEEVDEVEARSPDVTRTIHEDGRPKSERAELALAAVAVPPIPQQEEREKEKKEPRRPSVGSKSGNEWVFVSVDKGLGQNESESSGASPTPAAVSPPLDEAPMTDPPQLEGTRKGSFRRWFGRDEGRTKPKEVVVGASGKARRRRGGMAQALRSSKRLTIE